MSPTGNTDSSEPYAKIAEPFRSAALAIHYALHKVWTKAAYHREDYDKREWNKLGDTIDRLIRLADGQSP